MNLRQVILLRRDLLHTNNWTLGAISAQAVHAAVSCLHKYSSDDHVKEYLKGESNMTTIILSLDDQQELIECHDALTELHADHVVWYEMPENIPTAIAIKPYPKQVPHQCYLKKFQLFS